MGSFELMGAMQLLAVEGQQQLARAMFRAIGGALGRILRAGGADAARNAQLP